MILPRLDSLLSQVKQTDVGISQNNSTNNSKTPGFSYYLKLSVSLLFLGATK